MNKKLLSMAVAAAMVAPTAAMAEAILYGKLHMSIDWASVEDAQFSRARPPAGFNAKKYDGWGVNGGGAIPGVERANRIGVKGSEDLGNGMKAIYQVEFGIQMTEESADGRVTSGGDAESVTMRNTFAGLTGGWGTFVVGRNDTPYKTSTGKLDLFADTMADYNGTVGFDDVRADNAIAYVSPSLAGFQLAAAVHAGGASTAGFDKNLNSNSLAEAYSIAGIYSNGPFYASLAYESLGNELFMDTAASIANTVEDDYTKWRVGLGLLDWNGFTLAGLYEEQDDRAGNYLTVDPAQKLKLWQIQAGYSFGNNMVKAMYGSGDRNHVVDTLEGDFYTWAIAFDHNLSKRTKAYILYVQRDDDLSNTPAAAGATLGVPGGRDYNNLEWDGFSIGMIHNF